MLDVMSYTLVVDGFLTYSLFETFWLALFRSKKERIPPLALKVVVFA
jgi:hypothetical protein